MNIVLLEPKNRNNLATIIRSGQNFGVNTIFVIGGFVKDQYKGNIHKFSHQMNTQDGVSSVTLMYFACLADFLQHLPAQTTLVVVEATDTASDLRLFVHPDNATYLFGREAKGITQTDLQQIKQYFASLNKDIPSEFLAKHKKTVSMQCVQIETPQSLNLGVCASVVMYDRHSKRYCQ